MSHDFAKKPKATNKKKAPAKTQIAGWVWLLTGIAAGVFISFLVYLAGITPKAAPAEIVSKKPLPKSETKKTNTTKFDFYTLLPEREMIVPTEREESPSEPNASTFYILQAGSFKNASDADRLRAQLILMGLDARVDEVSVASGDLWHRVQLGPFSDRSQLSKARSLLINEGIDTLLLKRKSAK